MSGFPAGSDLAGLAVRAQPLFAARRKIGSATDPSNLHLAVATGVTECIGFGEGASHGKHSITSKNRLAPGMV